MLLLLFGRQCATGQIAPPPRPEEEEEEEGVVVVVATRRRRWWRWRCTAPGGDEA